MALSTLVALFSTVVLSSNHCPLSGFLSCGNSQKSQRATSGLYEGCWSNAILCLLRNCCTKRNVYPGTLSWWRSQSPHTRESFLTVNRRSPSIASRTRSILFNVFVVEGRLNENHYQQKCGLLWNDYTTLLFVFCSNTHSRRPSASSE